MTEIVRDQTYEGVEEFDIFGYDFSQKLDEIRDHKEQRCGV